MVDQPQEQDQDGAAEDDGREVPEEIGPVSRGRFRGRGIPVPGTDFDLRRITVKDADEILKDAGEDALEDREFMVRTLHRQLQPQPEIEAVQGWPYPKLLEVAGLFIAAVLVRNGVEGVSFVSFRSAVRSWWDDTTAGLRKTMGELKDLGLSKVDLSGILGSKGVLDQFALGMKVDLPKVDLSSFGKLSAVDPAILKSITDTSGIAKSLERFAAADMARPPLTSEIKLPILRNLQVEAIRDVEDELARARELQTERSEAQLSATVEQTSIMRAQGVLVAELVSEVRGLREDQQSTSAWAKGAVWVGAAGIVVAIVIAILQAVPAGVPGPSQSASPSPTVAALSPVPPLP